MWAAVRGQREIAERLRTIHIVTVGLLGPEAILKQLRFRGVGLRQQAARL